MADFELPQREGAPPQVNPGMPHLQLTDNAPDDIYDLLAVWLFSLPHVTEDRSRVSLPSSRAAWLKDVKINRLAQREFTHIHVEPGPGSQHLALPTEIADEVLAKGWGIEHPTNPYIHDFELLMIYAPRNPEDLEAVQQITGAAYDWATNV